MKRKKACPRTFENNYYMLKLVFQASPSYVIVRFLSKVLQQGMSLFFSLIFMRMVFNAIENQTSFQTIVIYVGFMLLVFFLLGIFQNWYTEIFEPEKKQVLSEKLNTMLFQKAVEIDVLCYKNTDFYNQYTRAAAETGTRPDAVLNSIISLVSGLLSGIFVFCYLFTIDHYAFLFTLVPVALSFCIGKRLNRLRFDINMKNVPFEREEGYVRRAYFLPDYAKELRISNISRVLFGQLGEAMEGLLANIREFGFRMGFWSFLNQFSTSVINSIGAIAYATVRMIILKNLLIGDYIVLVNAITSLASTIYSFTQIITSFMEHSMYIDNLRFFLEYTPQIRDGENALKPCGGVLELKNVSFTYEGQVKPALCNINMEIKPGQKIALVGHNGAGKTTLIKLLMRLYEAEEGEIRLNHVNIKQLKLSEYRDLFNFVPQDYIGMGMSIAENVAMEDVEKEGQRAKVTAALKKSGLWEKVSALPKGMDTMVTKEFDDGGIVFSGGENQKLALARAFYKGRGILIADEPSSALDPVAESRIYSQLLETFRRDTVIFISHRLSSVTQVDRIYYLENGRIAEQGTHSELMKLGKRYAELFQKQASSY